MKRKSGEQVPLPAPSATALEVNPDADQTTRL